MGVWERLSRVAVEPGPNGQLLLTEDWEPSPGTIFRKGERFALVLNWFSGCMMLDPLEEKPTRVVNPYTITPNQLQPGDNLYMLVKALVVDKDRYRVYRCPVNTNSVLVRLAHDAPQGDRVQSEDMIAMSLFPVLGWADMKPDWV